MDAVSAEQAAVAAQYGLDFEADSSQYAKKATNASLDTGDILFTLSARFKFESKGADRIIAGKFDEGSLSGREYALLYRTATDRISLWFVSAFGDQHIVAADAIGSPTVGTWYVATITHNSTTNATSITVNASSADTGSFSFGVRSGSADFRVGAGQNVTWLMDGVVDWVGLWKNRVLSSGDHTLLYNGGDTLDFSSLDPSLLTNLESWWDFAEDATPSTDQQGSNDLAWVGTPVRVEI